MIRRRGVLAALALVSSLTAAPASAVTYGDFVDSPQIQYPEVVPVWVGGSLCSGTLIEQQIVLTAAHCVYGRSGPIQIAVGGSTLNSGRLIDVTATWYHPRYDATYLQNDIALLHLRESAGVSRLASLPSPNAKKPKRFTMAGWGRDQNGLLTGKLSALNLSEYGDAAAKAFKGDYNPRTMIGAGRFFPNEALFGGGCQGDSGGPLYQGRSGSTRVVVGVTSWGAEGCVRYKPTIYTWVSYYVPELLVAVNQVKTRAIQSPIPTGRATPAGVGPTTTVVTSTTVRSTTTSVAQARVTPVQSSSTTVAQTTTTSISPIEITSVRACDGQQVGGQSYAGICVRWTNHWSIRTTQICGSVTMDGSSVTASVLFTGTGWQNSGSGCQVPEPDRDGKGNQATVFYVLNPSGNQRFQASFTVTDELGRTSTSSTSFSG